MTWGEFKTRVAREGVSDDCMVEHILFDRQDNCLLVCVFSDGTCMISGGEARDE